MSIQTEAAVWKGAVDSDGAKFVLRPAVFPNAAMMTLEAEGSEFLVAMFAQVEPGLVVLAAMSAATGAETVSEFDGHGVPDLRKRASRHPRRTKPNGSPGVATAAVVEPVAPMTPVPESPKTVQPVDTSDSEPKQEPQGTGAPKVEPSKPIKVDPRIKAEPARRAVMLWLVKTNPGITVAELQERPEMSGYGAVGRQTRKDMSSGKLTGSATEGLYLGAPGRPIASEGAPVDALAAAFQNSADAPSATARVVSVVAEAGPVDRARLREIFEETLPTVQRQINKLIANGRLAVSVPDESIEVTPEGLKYLKAS